MAKFDVPSFRTVYNYDRAAVTLSTGLSCLDESRAQQQFKDDSDPNVIMKQFARTRDLSLLQSKNPTYGDFSGAVDYQTSLNRVLQAQDDFAALPSSLRSRFNNDPAELLAFVSDADNREEAIKLGLLKADLSPPDASKQGKSGGGKSDAATPPAAAVSSSKSPSSGASNSDS